MSRVVSITTVTIMIITNLTKYIPFTDDVPPRSLPRGKEITKSSTFFCGMDVNPQSMSLPMNCVNNAVRINVWFLVLHQLDEPKYSYLALC